MKTYYSTSDMKKINKTVVDLGNSTNGYKFFTSSGLSAVGYNSGHFGWNYDIYDVNGITFIIGDRTPDMWHPKYDKDILKDIADKLDAVNYDRKLSLEERDKSRAALVEEFTDSIKKGIRTPALINSYTDFKKELAYQKDTRGDVSFASLANLLSKHLSPEGSVKVNIELGKDMEMAKKFYSRRFSGCKDKTDELEVCLGVVYERHKEKEREKENDIER